MGKKESDFAHLTKDSRAVALLSAEERVSRIRSEKWIGYSRAKGALGRLEELITWPSKQRMPNLLIIGPTNNGKTMIVEKFRRKYPAKDTKKDFDDLYMPVVTMQMPPDPSATRFYSMLLKSAGAVVRQVRVSDLEQAALNRMRSVQAKMLVIDELHNVLSGQSDVRREFLNMLRFLGNELKIPIVGVGIRDAYLTIKSDDQLENRFEPILLPKWEEGDELLCLLASFEAVLPLKRPSRIATEEMAKYILARTDGSIGEISKLLVTAAITAVKSGEERMSAKIFKLADYQSPAERRRTFERALQ
jgi:hypothetical protein